MKNIALITVFTLVFTQTIWAQVSVRPSSGQSRGIGAKTDQGSDSEKTRRSLRGSKHQVGGEEASKKMRGSQLGNQKGRAEAGNPSRCGTIPNAPKPRPNLSEIIKKELQLTEEQLNQLKSVYIAWRKAVKEFKGKKKFSELSESGKENLRTAYRKFRSARLEILSEEQVVKLRAIIAEARKIRDQKKELPVATKGKGAAEGRPEKGGQKGPKEKPGKGGQKLVYMLFTGSDWCPPCMKLEDTILHNSDFKAYSASHLKMRIVDFPRNNNQSKEEKAENNQLKSKFKISGFPTVVILDNGGREIARKVGFGSTKPSQYIAWLEKLAGQVGDGQKGRPERKPEQKPGQRKPESGRPGKNSGFEETAKKYKELAEKMRKEGHLDQAEIYSKLARIKWAGAKRGKLTEEELKQYHNLRGQLAKLEKGGRDSQGRPEKGNQSSGSKFGLGKSSSKQQKPGQKPEQRKPDSGRPEQSGREQSMKFPKHWGDIPAVQTRDYVRLPGNFGFGSSTLARWIEENMEEDAKKRREQGGLDSQGRPEKGSKKGSSERGGGRDSQGRPEKKPGGGLEQQRKPNSGRPSTQQGSGKGNPHPTLASILGAHQASEIQDIYKRFAPRFREILSNKELSEQKKKRELQELEDDREVLIRKQLDDEEYEKFKRLVRAGWRPGPAGR